MKCTAWTWQTQIAFSHPKNRKIWLIKGRFYAKGSNKNNITPVVLPAILHSCWGLTWAEKPLENRSQRQISSQGLPFEAQLFNSRPCQHRASRYLLEIVILQNLAEELASSALCGQERQNFPRDAELSLKLKAVKIQAEALPCLATLRATLLEADSFIQTKTLHRKRSLHSCTAKWTARVFFSGCLHFNYTQHQGFAKATQRA